MIVMVIAAGKYESSVIDLERSVEALKKVVETHVLKRRNVLQYHVHDRNRTYYI